MTEIAGIFNYVMAAWKLVIAGSAGAAGWITVIASAAVAIVALSAAFWLLSLFIRSLGALGKSLGWLFGPRKK